MVRILGACTFIALLALAGTAHASFYGGAGLSSSDTAFGAAWSDVQSDPATVTSDLTQTWTERSGGGNLWHDGGSVWKDDPKTSEGSHSGNAGGNYGSWSGTAGDRDDRSWASSSGSSGLDQWWASKWDNGDHAWWWSPEPGSGDDGWWWRGFPHEPGYPWGWYGNHGHQGVGVSTPLPSAILLFGPGLAGLAALRRKWKR